MTSRQCLFHQVSGCEKNKIDDTCISLCEKTSSLQNLKEETFLIEKSKGNYHRIYNETNYLNTEVIKDFPELFTGFMIDLRDINTESQVIQDKPALIKQFENLLKRNDTLNNEIKLDIENTNNLQYKKGI
jgi:putative protease